MNAAAPKPATGSRKIALAVSGSGRTLANFLQCQRAQGGYEVAAVVASRPDCKGLAIAEAHGLATLVTRFDHENLTAAAREVYPWLAAHGIGWVVLAGFVRPFPVTSSWSGRIVNIHPALLPHFGGRGMYGERVHRAVLAAGAAQSGATVHFVNERYDEGSTIAQIVVPVLADDSPTSLASRVFAAESLLYPWVVNQLIAGTIPARHPPPLILAASEWSRLLDEKEEAT